MSEATKEITKVWISEVSRFRTYGDWEGKDLKGCFFTESEAEKDSEIGVTELDLPCPVFTAEDHKAALAAARAEEREAAKVLEAALTILANNHGHCGHCGKLGDSPSFVSCGKRECTWEPPEPQGIAVLALERAAAIRTTEQEGEG